MSFTDIAATNAMFEKHFPSDDDRPKIIEMQDGFAVTLLRTDHRHMRPGNMVSGPTQMALADTVAYVCVFTKLGITPMAAGKHWP